MPPPRDCLAFAGRGLKTLSDVRRRLAGTGAGGVPSIARPKKGGTTVPDKLAPCLWFDGRAEEAARFYTSLLPDSRVDAIHRAPADYPSGKKGDVLTIEFTLAGRPFTGLNGGPHLTFNEAVSFQ